LLPLPAPFEPPDSRQNLYSRLMFEVEPRQRRYLVICGLDLLKLLLAARLIAGEVSKCLQLTAPKRHRPKRKA